MKCVLLIFFLEILGINYLESELTPITEEFPDVTFRKASFEIKEILPKNYKRHEECKDALEKANSSKTIRELLKFEEPRTITLCEIMLRIEEKLQELSIKYHSIKKNTDLLLYICLATFTKDDLFKIPPNCEDWRSVSMCTNAKQAMVLYADQSAQDFLKDKMRHLISKGTQF